MEPRISKRRYTLWLCVHQKAAAVQTAFHIIIVETVLKTGYAALSAISEAVKGETIAARAVYAAAAML